MDGDQVNVPKAETRKKQNPLSNWTIYVHVASDGTETGGGQCFAFPNLMSHTHTILMLQKKKWKENK